MTQDTYLRIVKQVLATDSSVRVYDSHQSKLNSLARCVARGECLPKDTIADIESIFHPWISRSLKESLERALR